MRDQVRDSHKDTVVGGMTTGQNCYALQEVSLCEFMRRSVISGVVDCVPDIFEPLRGKCSPGGCWGGESRHLPDRARGGSVCSGGEYFWSKDWRLTGPVCELILGPDHHSPGQHQTAPPQISIFWKMWKYSTGNLSTSGSAFQSFFSQDFFRTEKYQIRKFDKNLHNPDKRESCCYFLHLTFTCDKYPWF